MPVGRAGDGPNPLINPGEGEVQEIKTQSEKISAEPQMESPAEEGSVLSKESLNRKAELNADGDWQKFALNSQLSAKTGATSRLLGPLPDAPHPIVIRGTSGNDFIHISKAPGLTGELGMLVLDVNGEKQFLTKEQASRLEIHAGAGNDTVVIDANVNQGIKVYGDKGNDVIIGGGGDDQLDGGSGNDVIMGRGGNDVIRGGRGDDTLSGGDGNDVIEGGRGDDVIRGGRGDDTLSGGSGSDVIEGEDGNDTIDGGRGDDVLLGGDGNDHIYGGRGNDVIVGGRGNDTVDGGTGSDVVLPDPRKK